MSEILTKLKENSVRIGLSLLVLIIFVAHAAHRPRLGFVEQMENIAYDQRMLWTMPETVDNRIVIVDIDERSLSAEGRWPWSRNTVAKLVENLFDDYEAAVVGFDIVFAEPDESSGLSVLEQLAKNEFAEDENFQAQIQLLQPSLDYDGLFSETIQKYPVILGYYFNFADLDEEVSKIGVLPEPAFVKGTFKGKRIEFLDAQGFGGNLTQLQSSALGGGHFNPVPDRDGVMRRVPMLIEYEGAYFSSLSLEMARHILGDAPVAPVFEKPLFGGKGYMGLEWLQLATKQIPVDKNVSALVPYRGRQGSFPYVSATDIIHGTADKSVLKGATILVGTTAPGLQDLRVTHGGRNLSRGGNPRQPARWHYRRYDKAITRIYSWRGIFVTAAIWSHCCASRTKLKSFCRYLGHRRSVIDLYRLQLLCMERRQILFYRWPQV